MSFKPLIIASRQSPLAVAQAKLVRTLLCTAIGLSADQKDSAFPIQTHVTTGDRRMDDSLSEIGGKGLFTKEVEAALLTGKADIAVHSMKDMPAKMPDGLMLTAVTTREDPRDVLVTRDGRDLESLSSGAVLGTSSIRRRAQMSKLRPDLSLVPLRGNVGSRLAKLQSGEVDATLLAQAGLNRLGLPEIKQVALSTDLMLPAPGQGVLCIQTRSGDDRAQEICSLINCAETAIASAAERAMVEKLDASCKTPMGAYARIIGDRLEVRGELLSPDGKHVYTDEQVIELSDKGPDNMIAAAVAGTDLAQTLSVKAGDRLSSILGRT